MTRTREEALNEECHDEQKRENHAAEPPGNGRPLNPQRHVRKELEKEHAGSGEDRTGKKKSGAEDQGNAVLGALETDQGYGSENKGEKTADDLEVALKNRIRLKSNMTKPRSSKNHKNKGSEMRQEDGDVAAAVAERTLAHDFPQMELIPHNSPTH